MIIYIQSSKQELNKVCSILSSMATLPRVFCCCLVMMMMTVFSSAHPGLSPFFYDVSCPQANDIVMSILEKAIAEDPRMAASLLRLHFHDCFVQVKERQKKLVCFDGFFEMKWLFPLWCRAVMHRYCWTRRRLWLVRKMQGQTRTPLEELKWLMRSKHSWSKCVLTLFPVQTFWLLLPATPLFL